MKTLLLFISILFISASPVFAGGGHAHNADGSHSIASKIGKKVVIEVSGKVIKSLIKAKKIAESWSLAKQTSVGQKRFSGNLEWVIVYNNSQEKDANKQNLFVFLSLRGEYLGSNFTGQ